MSDVVKHVAFTSSTVDVPGGHFDVHVGSKDEDDDDEEAGYDSTTSTEDEDRRSGQPFPSSAKRTRKSGVTRERGVEPGLDMEFTRWREAVVVVCLIFYVSDLLLDAWVLRTFVLDGNLRQAWFMGFCMLVPNLYAGYKSLQWYLRAFECQVAPVTDPKIWLVRVLFFPISLVLRYYDVLRRGYKARAAGAQGQAALQRRQMVRFVSESAEVAMLRLFIIFLEDAPICVLNLMTVLDTAPEDIDKVGYSVGVVVAKLSCSITMGVVHYASLTKVAYHACRYWQSLEESAKEPSSSRTTSIVTTRASRRGLRHKGLPSAPSVQTLAEFHSRADLSPLAHLLFYCWQFTTIGSRLVCYALFASILLPWLLLLAAVRWLINTVCILLDVPNMSLANCAAFGGVYLFTFVSTSTDSQHIRLALYYAVNIIEATGVSVLWWTSGADNVYQVMGLGLLIGGTAHSVLFMVIYYACGHPNRKNTWGWRKLFRRGEDITEATKL